MRKVSKLVKILVTLILTLSMVLGSYVGVFASWKDSYTFDPTYTYAVLDTHILKLNTVSPGNSKTINLVSKNVNGTKIVVRAWETVETSQNVVDLSANATTFKNITAKQIGTVTVRVYYDVQKWVNGHWVDFKEYYDDCIVYVGNCYTITHVDVDETGSIDYAIYTDGVKTSESGISNATVSDIKIYVNGVLQSLTDIGSQKRATLNTTICEGLDVIVVTATVSGTINGVVVSLAFTATYDTKAEFDALKAACNDHSGFDVIDPTVSTILDYYTATFNFENGSSPSVTTYIKGSDITPPSDPIKADLYSGGVKVESYTFAGWLEEDSSLVETSDFTNITSTRTFTASYTTLGYNTVTFKDDDGTTLDSRSEIADGSYLDDSDIPEGLTKADDTSTIGIIIKYVFAGWNDGFNTYSKEDILGMAVNEDKTYYAVYTPTEFYDVSFYDGNGNIIGTTESVEEENTVTSIPSAADKDTVTSVGTLTTFTFNGNWQDEDGNVYSSAGVQALSITEPKTFTAQFTATDFYDVSFYDGNGNIIGSTESVEDEDYVSSVPATAIKDEESNAGIRTTYAFNGNWEDEDGNIYTSAEVQALMITEPKTFTAQFDPTYFYTINFYEEDGTTFIDFREIQAGGNLTDFPTAPPKSDSGDGLYYYTFNNWVALNDDPVSFEEITGPFDVKARYAENGYILVNFYVELPDSTVILIDTQYILPGSDATDPGPEWMILNDYILGDWDGGLTGITQDTDLTAQAATIAGAQEKNEYTVNFYVQLPDGSKILIDTQKVLAGDDATDPGAAWMLKNGYILGPWNGSLTDIMKDTDLTARAATVAGAVETEVQTGDTAPIVSMGILLVAAAFSITLVTARKRKDA